MYQSNCVVNVYFIGKPSLLALIITVREATRDQYVKLCSSNVRSKQTTVHYSPNLPVQSIYHIEKNIVIRE